MSDLISRSDAIKAIVNTGSEVAYHDTSGSVLFGSAFRQKEIIDIINALPSAEAVTHGRLIDADALSEKLCETTIFIKDGEVFQRMINDAPTVSAEAKWIPCSERLPSNDGCVLISIAGDIEFGAYDRQNSDWSIWMDSHWVWIDSHWDGGKVVDAWMPLPKPYREDGE